MRLIDSVFRQGHLSERALVDAIVTGNRPPHLDRCDLCAERAVELARWTNDLQTDAAQMADDVFTPERLQAQQQQILRRLEQLDHPARVIAFPTASRSETNGVGGRRVAVSWVGIAAAAGLVIGVVSGQVSARMAHQAVQVPVTATATDPNALVPSEISTGPVDSSLFAEPLENLNIKSLDVLDEATPKMMQVSARRGG